MTANDTPPARRGNEWRAPPELGRPHHTRGHPLGHHTLGLAPRQPLRRRGRLARIALITRERLSAVLAVLLRSQREA